MDYGKSPDVRTPHGCVRLHPGHACAAPPPWDPMAIPEVQERLKSSLVEEDVSREQESIEIKCSGDRRELESDREGIDAVGYSQCQSSLMFSPSRRSIFS